MAVVDNTAKVLRLMAYVEVLRNRLSTSVPPRHADRPQEFKAMLETDLKKTLITIDKLKS